MVFGATHVQSSLSSQFDYFSGDNGYETITIFLLNSMKMILSICSLSYKYDIEQCNHSFEVTAHRSSKLLDDTCVKYVEEIFDDKIDDSEEIVKCHI